MDTVKACKKSRFILLFDQIYLISIIFQKGRLDIKLEQFMQEQFDAVLKKKKNE